MVCIYNIYAKLAKRILSNLLSDNQIPIPRTKVGVSPCSSLLTPMFLTPVILHDAPRCTNSSSCSPLCLYFLGGSLVPLSPVLHVWPIPLSIGPHCPAFIGSSSLFLLIDHFGLDLIQRGGPRRSSPERHRSLGKIGGQRVAICTERM